MSKIENVSQFIEKIITLTTNHEDNSKNIYWFRGEASSEFETPLVPNAYRVLSETLEHTKNKRFFSKNIKSIESNIDAEYYRKSFRYLKESKVKNNFVNRYFLIQHYGIQTRLLDWSENALIALYFAVSSNKDRDGRIWILNPFGLNNITFQKILGSEKNCKMIPTFSDNHKRKRLFNKEGKFRMREISRRYLLMDFSNDKLPESSYFPLAIYPPYLENRLQFQSGCFTIFGNEINGLMEIEDSKILNSLIIDKNNKQKILKELEILGISENSIYPGLDGLGKSLKTKYSQKYFDNTEAIFHVLQNQD
ncbi:FRG domain-containing protein [Elizabethkingia sp. YR214]|uniref:FRG domain-containing protein n=1 Tax=Elizabethkingia sp. YR214 TaxID=2135667 RepID=UPI000D3262EB|nr:FRG domain-containing protein [Elizabethkingia sp. YR214]PUB33674.1 FRG domain-containing protein [Elizabethkingia sp. YR214]